MRGYFLCIIVLLLTTNIFAQNTFTAIIKDRLNADPLAGVSINIKGTKIATISAKNGQVILNNISNGKLVIELSMMGYNHYEKVFDFPLADSLKDGIIFLDIVPGQLNEVIVQSTRTSRTIKNTPTRIEVIDEEELNEKINMKPADVAMVLHESTGIQVQQTSATSGNASLRIQGLDGRYTQLLKDGYPSFGNFASGLSLLEIPPLDLKQVEIIKGPASTLYGAGAVAGVVNFISKTPKEKAEYNLILNQSNVGQSSIGGFAMHRNKKIGYSILGLYNHQEIYDVDKDGFSELPLSSDFTIYPKLFYYPSLKTTFIVGNSFTKGARTGGDVNVVEGKPDNEHVYFETNNSIRNTSTVDFIQKLPNKAQLTLKASFSYFDRSIFIPDYTFKGSSYNVFNDFSYARNLQNQTIIFGINYIRDKFVERKGTSLLARNFLTKTAGLYVQHTWDISTKLKLESGLRTDFVQYKNQQYSKREFFILPKISALYRFNNNWSSRVGGGLGYKTPTIFTEQTETAQYQHVLPLNNVTSERSYGATADVTFKTAMGNSFVFSINQLFFYTIINNATVLQKDINQNYYFVNSNQKVISTGFETNAKLIFKEDFKLFAGYTYTHATAKYLTGNQFLPLLPQNKLNLALVYEKEGNFKMGFEGYFSDYQYLYNGFKTPSYWEFGFMVEKTFSKISLFINFENFTDQRQSKYKRVVNPPFTNPTFDDIWNHTEGRTVNTGVKIKL